MIVEAAEAAKSLHPQALWSVAVALGFVGWIGSGAGLISLAWPEAAGVGKPFRIKLIWLSLVLALGALWFAGMVMA